MPPPNNSFSKTPRAIEQFLLYIREQHFYFRRQSFTSGHRVQIKRVKLQFVQHLLDENAFLLLKHFDHACFVSLAEDDAFLFEIILDAVLDVTSFERQKGDEVVDEMMIDDRRPRQAAFLGVEDGETDDGFEILHRELFAWFAGAVEFVALFGDAAAAGVGQEEEDGESWVEGGRFRGKDTE